MLADCVSTRTRTWRCLLVLLFAVAAIVTGILAMHVVSTPVAAGHEIATSQPPGAAAAAASHGADARGADARGADAHPAVLTPAMPHRATSGGCASDGCDPLHDMTAMVCTLALLAATILLIAPALARALLDVGMRAAPSDLIRTVARTIGSSPPSLLALSVDRR